MVFDKGNDHLMMSGGKQTREFLSGKNLLAKTVLFPSASRYYTHEGTSRLFRGEILLPQMVKLTQSHLLCETV